jgi:GntR family transcriptional regulator/MocR family aminotransferase
MPCPTKAHQFPLGMPMSLSRRMQLLEWACRRQALIVEDDYDSEFRFDGRPMESLKSLDSTGVVAYVGTFSKTIFPELRIGYAVPPPALYQAMRKAKLASDWHSCTMTQAALAKFMLDGYFAKHLRRMHKTYASRRHALLQHLHGDLRRWMTPLPASAGLHLVAQLKAPLRETQVVALAERASIGLYGTAAMYGALAPAPGLLFGYGGIDVAGIHTSLTQLAGLLATIVH